jgi:hypothetical protein
MKNSLPVILGCVFWLQTMPVAAQPEMPKPGPEHKQLAKLVGKWDVAVQTGGMESKGSATYTMGLDGFWLFEDFHAEFAGMKFHGRGVTGYDQLRKTYVGAWIDSMSPSLLVMHGHYSKDGKTYTSKGEGPGMDGKLTKLKGVYEFKDDDNFTFKLYQVADGKDTEMMALTYRRQK